MMLKIAIIGLLLAMILLLIELMIPGFGIFGIAGVVLILCSIYAFFSMVLIDKIIFIIITIVFVFATYFIFKTLKKKLFHRGIILSDTLNEVKKEYENVDFLMGKTGKTTTTLRPFGEVDFNGTRMQVYSDGSYISENKLVKVVRIEGEKVIVNEINNN